MNAGGPAFDIKDCTLLTKMSGLPPVFDVRDLRDRIAVCRPSVIYHHYCETPLSPSFDYPDFRNDFAVWSKRQLEDNILAERLGMIDPYTFNSMEDLRNYTLDVIDERLCEIHTVTSVEPGHEFYFQDAITIIFDTGHVIHDPSELQNVIPMLTYGSVYYHFLEARRRTRGAVDDFSIWMENFGKEWEPYIEALRSIDFLFYTLPELKQELTSVLRRTKGTL